MPIVHIKQYYFGRWLEGGTGSSCGGGLKPLQGPLCCCHWSETGLMQALRGDECSDPGGLESRETELRCGRCGTVPITYLISFPPHFNPTRWASRPFPRQETEGEAGESLTQSHTTVWERSSDPSPSSRTPW